MEGEASLDEALLSQEGGTAASTVATDASIDASVLTAKRASRPTVQDCLGLPERETAAVELDVYNMFYISDLWSLPFFYSIAVLAMKMALYIILIVDLLLDPAAYPFDRKKAGVEVKLIVMLAQLFLIPVAILVQEELRVSFFVFGNLQYSPGITRRHPSATKWKWYTANTARLVDGVMFLFVNTYLMLLTVNMLSIFLNFAALMFLQTVDNVALQVCLDGYWTRSLQDCAKDVVEMRFAFRQRYGIRCLKGREWVLWAMAVYVAILGCWVKVHFFD